MGLIVLSAHGIACVLVARARGVHASRRVIAVAFVLTVPVFGLLLACLAVRVRGRGQPDLHPDTGLTVRPRARFGVEEARRLCDRTAVFDLFSDDVERRRDALASLALKRDRASIEAIRFALENGSPETALDAAMTLEDLICRLDQRRAELTARAAEEDSFETALAAADAAAEAIHCDLADVCLHGGLAEEARTFYARAIRLDPDRRAVVAQRWARLELAVGCSDRALELLGELGSDALAAEGILAEAAFALRRFDLLPQPGGAGAG